MKAPKRPVYLVSGDTNIRPADVNLRRSGRKVRYDTKVDIQASRALTPGRPYVVVAHGTRTGIVTLYRSDIGRSRDWLWAGMSTPPRGVRFYLYACYGGLTLPARLKGCECAGHVGEVPMPTLASKREVLRFLGQVDRYMTAATWDSKGVRRALARHVNDRLAAEADKGTDIGSIAALLVLRRSLGNIDE